MGGRGEGAYAHKYHSTLRPSLQVAFDSVSKKMGTIDAKTWLKMSEGKREWSTKKMWRTLWGRGAQPARNLCPGLRANKKQQRAATTMTRQSAEPGKLFHTRSPFLQQFPKNFWPSAVAF